MCFSLCKYFNFLSVLREEKEIVPVNQEERSLSIEDKIQNDLSADGQLKYKEMGCIPRKLGQAYCDGSSPDNYTLRYVQII